MLNESVLFNNENPNLLLAINEYKTLIEKTNVELAAQSKKEDSPLAGQIIQNRKRHFGCGSGVCSLLAPQCRNGGSRVKTAQTEYYNTYGEQ